MDGGLPVDMSQSNMVSVVGIGIDREVTALSSMHERASATGLLHVSTDINAKLWYII